MAKIPTHTLNTGGQIPAIGFGTWQLSQGRQAVSCVGQALTTGYRLIDTAMMYANERSVGEAIRNSLVPRQDIFVTTKLWPTDFGYDNTLTAFERSRSRLGLDCVDLYLIHWPQGDRLLRMESWRALEDLYRDGLCKAIGVSNYKINHLKEVLRSAVKPAVNQIPFHPFIYKQQLPILKFCKSQGIVVEAYSPLSRTYQFDNPILGEIAGKYSKTKAQIMLRWSIQHGAIPIPKSAQKDRMAENIRVFDFELGAGDISKLNKLSGPAQAA